MSRICETNTCLRRLDGSPQGHAELSGRAIIFEVLAHIDLGNVQLLLQQRTSFISQSLMVLYCLFDALKKGNRIQAVIKSLGRLLQHLA